VKAVLSIKITPAVDVGFGNDSYFDYKVSKEKEKRLF